MKRIPSKQKVGVSLPGLYMREKQILKTKPILSQRKSLLSTFEREYLDHLQRREQPKARVKFLSSEATSRVTDVEYSPDTALSPLASPRKRLSLLKSPSKPSVSLSDRQESDLITRLPRFKDYYKNISQSKKLFDATNFEEKPDGFTSV